MCMTSLQAEDNLAQASCLVGDLISARDHCKASIEVNFLLGQCYNRLQILLQDFMVDSHLVIV